MNYLLFNNEILISKGVGFERIDNIANYKNLLALNEARVCVVDVDVLVASAVESPIEKKDSLLVRKFEALYQHEAYIIQDERIDNNLFQVIGIKEQKVREVYSLIPSKMIDLFIPYGVALRNTLVNNKIDLNKTVVFVDTLGTEKLLTVFDGLKFSRTRVIADNAEDILPEIKRSQIDFFKKNEEYLNKKGTDFLIVVNNQSLAAEISKNSEKLRVEYLDIRCPALEGLKEIETSIKYRLPEEILQKRKEIELQKNVKTTTLSLCVITVGLLFFLFNRVELGVLNSQFELAKQANEQLEGKLTLIDKETYREDLMRHKTLNYGISYLAMLELIPASYEVGSFEFLKSARWNLEVSLLADENGPFDPIPKIKILKNAEIKDTFVNNQPGKHLKIIL